MDSYSGNSANEMALDSNPEYQLTLFVLLLCICVVIGHLIEKARWMTESVTALIIGLFTGILILLITEGRSSHILVFNEQIFFLYILPPIIFNAGFQVQKKPFFNNFLIILSFGAVGSVISFLIISFGSIHLFQQLDIGFLVVADYFALGAILTATDSVCTLQVLNQDQTPLLYSVVFGEGVVNDATSVVIFKAIQKFDFSHFTPTNAFQLVGHFFYLFFTSTLLGILFGLLTAYIIKKLYFARHSTDREVALMILMPYLSYMISDLCNLSGILTVFVCGIVMSHYAWNNITQDSRVTTKHTFATLSFIAEIFIFLYVGMDALDIEKWRIVSRSPGTSVGVSTIMLGLVLVGRAAFVVPLTFLSNMNKKPQHRIGFKHQITIWWAGLMRGAVSIALAYDQFTRSGHTQLQGNAVMITSTITLVLFTNMVWGLFSKPIIRYLLSPNSETGTDSSLSDLLLPYNEDIESGDLEMLPPTSLWEVLETPGYSIHYFWQIFDDRFMRPIFGGRGFVPCIPDSPSENYVY